MHLLLTFLLVHPLIHLDETRRLPPKSLVSGFEVADRMPTAATAASRRPLMDTFTLSSTWTEIASSNQTFV
jgi:hypothetical protein